MDGGQAPKAVVDQVKTPSAADHTPEAAPVNVNVNALLEAIGMSEDGSDDDGTAWRSCMWHPVHIPQGDEGPQEPKQCPPWHPVASYSLQGS